MSGQVSREFAEVFVREYLPDIQRQLHEAGVFQSVCYAKPKQTMIMVGFTRPKAKTDYE